MQGLFAIGLLLLLSAGSGRSQNPAQDLLFEPVATGFDRPVSIAFPPDGSGRMFVVEQRGRILVVDPLAGVLPIPFLDVSEQVRLGGERGLFDIEFHPNFEQNGWFYIHYTNLEGQGDTVVSRFEVSDDPNRAAIGSETVIFTLVQPNVTHNGGELEFGPDDFLYIALGDGGAIDIPSARVSRSLENPFGKILRIDVDSAEPYAIPESNPFVGDPVARGEIWLYGLRNPWRFSFDRATGDLFIGDVGSSVAEEVHYAPAGASGLYFGWPALEGGFCLDAVSGCEPEDSEPPIIAILRDEETPCQSITGGYRYRGTAMPDFAGRYFFSDWCTQELWTATETDEGWQLSDPLDTELQIAAFGEDTNGELYAADYLEGTVYRLRTVWPAAEISAVSPNRAAAGGGPFQATIAGEGFVEGAEALLDGEPLPTLYVDATRLIAAISTEEIESATELRLEVRNPEPNAGLGAAATIVVEPTNGIEPTSDSAAVVHAATFESVSLAPGQLASVFGAGLALSEESAALLPLPTSLGGAILRLGDGAAAPVLFASPGQINFLVPESMEAGGSLQFIVELGPNATEPLSASLAAVSPGVFTLDQTLGGQGAVLIAGTGIVAAPLEAYPGSRPASAGECIEIYCSGLGALEPGSGSTLAPVEVWFGETRVDAAYAGLAPGFSGLYQVNAAVPDEAALDPASPLLLRIQGASSNQVGIAID